MRTRGGRIMSGVATLGCLTLALAGLVAAPASAASPTLSITILLAPQDGQGLAGLAVAPRLDPGQRRTRLRETAPSATTADRATAQLVALGLRVTSQTAYSIRAIGPAALVTSLFGSTADAHGVRGRVGLHLPAGLRTLATAAVGGDEITGLWQHHVYGATYGAQVRSRYAAPVKSGAITPTIATIQFSGFNSGDLTSFATGTGLPDPVASGQFTPLSVDGVSTTVPVGGGNVEVALDQEALLATAPQANQRAYFANNTAQGYIDILNAIATDAASKHIVAAATSWGLCEAYVNSATAAAFHTALANLAAAGVTFFASTGDYGSNDCQDNPATAHIDFPASDPLAVAVGGTTVSGGSLTAWSGGGGGESAIYTRPSWQAPVWSSTMRAVPDIAMQADPDYNGFPVIVNGSPTQVGGTSLSSQLAAATFTNVIVGRGATGGVGDIHAALYSAQSCGVTDVAAGSNGAYTAAAGFDLTTGLGAPRWSQLAYALLPSTIPGAYEPLCPARVLDTRVTSYVAPHGTVNLKIAGTRGVPAGIRAITVNLTAVSPSAPGYITAYAGGSARPGASNLNFLATKTSANLAIVPVAANGTISIYNGSAGRVDLVADIEGFHIAGTPSTAGTYTPLNAPTRVLDTRVSGPAAGANGTVAVPVAGVAGIPAGVSAVAINLTATRPTASGYATVYATGATRPGASNLNFVTGQTVANLAIVPIGPDGSITLFNGSNGTTNFVVDVQGYVLGGTPAATGSTAFIAPTRALDTRASIGPMAAGTPLSLYLPAVTAVPSNATAVILNLTATGSTAPGYITVWPAGATRPNASNLNLAPGRTVANLVILPLTSGSIWFYNGSSGSTQLIADVQGYVLG